MDIKSKENRSKNMAKIRSKNTKPEIYIRGLLYAQGLRYRVNYKEAPGTPDLYFIGPNVSIFINGCFWHRHKGCKYAYMPKSNISFWERKFQNNINHDNIVRQKNAEQGIRELVIWECTVKQMQKDEIFRERIVKTIVNYIFRNQGVAFLEI